MRKSIFQATITGIILAALLSVGFYLMILLPKDTSVSSYTNIVLFIGVAAIGTWLSLKNFTMHRASEQTGRLRFTKF